MYNLRIRLPLLVAALATFSVKPAAAVNISDTGVGEALIFPYYTAVNGQITLLSITNRTDKPKALKVHFREGMNGAPVLSFNLFLAAQDVWTSAIAPTADGAGIVTADGSCTNPKFPTTAITEFRNQGFISDAPLLRTKDRTREGYLEVFEMAVINPESPLGKDVSFEGEFSPSRKAACKLVTNQSIAENRADFLAPSGGLSGSATIVSTFGSMSTGYDAIALQALGIQTGATAADSTSPDWTDVTNTTAMLVDGSDPTNPRMIAARFDRGVDAVSALFMNSALSGEYAYTNVLGTDWIVTMPTKRLYVNSGAPLGPFKAAWDGLSGKGVAETEISLTSFTREAKEAGKSGICGVPPPSSPPAINWSTGVFKFLSSESSASALSARNAQVWAGRDDCGAGVAAIQDPNSEGGWGLLQFAPRAEAAPSLVSRSDSIVISKNGSQTVGSLKFVGLPAIGIGVSAAIFPAARYENYNSSYWLKGTRLIR